MKTLRIATFIFLSLSAIAQPKFEIQEFTGVVKSIEPGFRFALEYLMIEVNGQLEGFSFYPQYGTFINEKIKPGDKVSLKANVNLRIKKLRIEMDEANKALSWFMFNDRITEIKIGNEWIALPEKESGYSPAKFKVFLEKEVKGDYWKRGFRSGLIFENGLVASYMGFNKYFDPMSAINKGDRVSFNGYKMGVVEGYQYPIEGVTEVYHFSPLTKTSGKLFSYLYKQNSVCIGAKFETSKRKHLSVSFPSDDAERIRRFLKTDSELEIYYNNYKIEGQLHPPELHALVKPGDTLYITKFGFYGGADVKHDHKEITIEGKITRINTSEKGNIISVIVASEYYVEIDAMMAQQLGYFFQKGKEVIIQGKERIKKEGEVYQKDQRIVTPEKVVVDGKTFLLYNP
jgi:hypothetical protein